MKTDEGRRVPKRPMAKASMLAGMDWGEIGLEQRTNLLFEALTGCENELRATRLDIASRYNEIMLRLRAIEKRLARFSPHPTERFLDQIEARADELGKALNRITLQQTVATEVRFLVEAVKGKRAAERFSRAVILAFDEPEAFWQDFEKLPLGEAIARLEELSSQL